MNAPKVTDLDYIQFLIAAQGVYACTEAARCAVNASHDAYTRLLSRLPPIRSNALLSIHGGVVAGSRATGRDDTRPAGHRRHDSGQALRPEE